MITVELSERKGEITMTVKGHANQAEHGKDIVCASASILAYTAASLVWDAYGDEKLYKEPSTVLDPGDAVISCKPRSYWRKNVARIYKFAMKGYGLLAEQYPDYVVIKA